MAVINTGLISKGLRSEFFNRFNNTPTYYQQLATRIVSTSDSESYRWLGTVPKMREWGTGRIAQGLRSESYSVENLKYEATIEVDRDEIADDQTGQIRLRIGELATRAATHKDYLIAKLLIHGETAGYNSYDGVPFFSAGHESGDSGQQSNLLTYNVTATDDPTLEEFKAAVKQAIATMINFKDDQGEPMHQTATGLYVVVPPNLYLTALEVVNAALIDNVSNVLHGAAQVLAMPQLTDQSKWYLLKTDAAIRPFIFQDREPVEFSALTEETDEGFKREKFLFGVRARYRLAYGYWQNALRTDLI